MKSDLISVIVPVYNAEKYLVRCIDSILEQTYRDFELLLIDDGSVDRSGDICDKYAQSDHRIRVIHKENGGVSSARNIGLEAAQGKHITFVDSDDFVSPTYLQELHRTIQTGADIAMCNFAYYVCDDVRNSNERLPDQVFLDKGNIKYIQFVSRFLRFEDNIFGSACRVLWKREVIGNLRFNQNIHISEDLLFLLQTFENAAVFKSTENVGYYYRLNDFSATRSYKKKYLQSQVSLHRELEFLFGTFASMRPVLDTYSSLLCYYVLSNEIKFRHKGWHQNIREARKSELYSYFKIKNGLKLHGKKQKIKFLIIWFLVKFRLV